MVCHLVWSCVKTGHDDCIVDCYSKVLIMLTCFRKSQSGGNHVKDSCSLSITENKSLQELREESPEKKSRFKVMQAMDTVQKEEAKENPSKNRFQVQPASQPDEVIENKSDETKDKPDLVVEKQDMEKLEKDEESNDAKVEKRGRFNIKTDDTPPVVEPTSAVTTTTTVEAASKDEAKVKDVETKPDPPAQSKESEKVVEVDTSKEGSVGKDAKEPEKEPEPIATVEEKKTVVDDKKVEEDDKDEDITQSEEEEPKKAVDSSPDGGRYLKFDEEIGRGSFKTVYKGLMKV